MNALSPLLLTLLASTAGPEPAATQAEHPTDAKALLALRRQALGASEALQAVKGVESRARGEWVGLDQEGVVEEHYGGFRQIASKSSYEAFGDFRLGAAGERFFWEQSPLGVTIRTGWDAAQFLRMFEIPRHTDWRQLYQDATLEGLRTLEDGRECHVLRMRPRALYPLSDDEPREAPDDLWFLERDTHLLARVELPSAGSPSGGAVLELRDYREVDGVRYAHRQGLRISGFELLLHYETIRHVDTLPQDLFTPNDDVLTAFEEQRSGKAAERDAQIVVEDVEVRHIASIRLETPHRDMQKTLSILLPEVLQHVLAEGAQMDGQPLVRYHSFGDAVDLEAAIPVRSPIRAKGRVKPSTLPAGLTASAWHVGPYDRLGDAYERLQAHFAEHELEPNGAPWEVYWTDPGLEPDPQKWRTQLFWPVQRR